MSSPYHRRRGVPRLAVVSLVVSIGGAVGAQSPVVTPASAENHLLFAAPLATDLPSPHFAVGDLDGDGLADVLVSDLFQLLRHPGLGDGSFGAAVSLPGAGFAALELADLNGDGWLDAVGGTAFPVAAVRIAFGDGAGGLGPVHAHPFPMQTNLDTLQLGLGDADGDGDLDLAVAASPNSPFLPNGGYLALAVNDGSGTFTLQPIPGLLSLQDGARALPADLNGDGLGDLLLATAVGGGYVQRVLLGLPGGGFELHAELPAATGAARLVHLNGDAHLDLLTTTAEGFRTWLGSGNGSFHSPQDVFLGGAADGVAAGDLDGDGQTDVVAFRSLTGEAFLCTGTGNGSVVLSAIGSLALPPLPLRAPRLADVNGDGRLDLVGLRGAQGVQPPACLVARNATYAAGGPLSDWGGALRGAAGFPIQIAAGSFLPGQAFEFRLQRARPGGAAFHVIGLAPLFAPFKSGVLVPRPDLLTGPWPLDAAGELLIAGSWPAGLPAGASLILQFWCADPLGPAGFSASTALELVQP